MIRSKMLHLLIGILRRIVWIELIARQSLLSKNSLKSCYYERKCNSLVMFALLGFVLLSPIEIC